jgi:hypothetical protein
MKHMHTRTHLEDENDVRGVELGHVVLEPRSLPEVREELASNHVLKHDVEVPRVWRWPPHTACSMRVPPPQTALWAKDDSVQAQFGYFVPIRFDVHTVLRDAVPLTLEGCHEPDDEGVGQAREDAALLDDVLDLL